MDSFKGFPSIPKLSALPSDFFTSLLSRIDDIDELKATLAVLYLMSEKRKQPRFVSLDELAGSNLLENMAQCQYDKGLSRAVERGTFLHLQVDRNGKQQSLYFLNAAPEKKALESIRAGSLSAGSLEEKAFVRNEKNIFTLYEENVGQLTPLVVEELEEAEKEYPLQWIEEAFKEAGALNKRNWRYISRILERWAVEGKSGKTGRHSSKEFDPQDYFKGRYGHIVHGQKR